MNPEAEESVSGPDDPGNGPTPEGRARSAPAGVPVVMGDGNTWLFARCGLCSTITSLRDEIYASSMTRGGVAEGSILAAAWFALAVNYDLSDDELRALLAATDPGSIVNEITEAVLPLPPSDLRADFTEWALSALHANGLDPADIPEAMLPWTLEQLVLTGRAVPHEQFTAAGIAGARAGKFRGLAADARAKAQLPTG